MGKLFGSLGVIIGLSLLLNSKTIIPWYKDHRDKVGMRSSLEGIKFEIYILGIGAILMGLYIIITE